MVTKAKLDAAFRLSRRRYLQILIITLLLLYMAFIFYYEYPLVGGSRSDTTPHPLNLDEARKEFLSVHYHSKLSVWSSLRISPSPNHHPPPNRRRRRRTPIVSSLLFNDDLTWAFSELHKLAIDAFEAGLELFKELESAPSVSTSKLLVERKNQTKESCPPSIMFTGAEFGESGRVMVLPCGLTVGSHITLVARPHSAHAEYESINISKPKEGDQAVMVSHFTMELQGLKSVDGEEPPKILHFNPRLRGDWSRKPVIEMNTCYRMKWGRRQRCQGLKSRAHEETVDRLVKCEEWIVDDGDRSEELKTTRWLNSPKSTRRKRIGSIEWRYPFVEDKLFVLTLRAGLEGYHVNVDGRHVTSFPYRIGFVLEDATGLAIYGDLDVESVFAVSLPTSQPNFATQRSLELSTELQALLLPTRPVELFIGIISVGSHVAERMAVRKTWMSAIRKSSTVVARFFVALHGRNEVNIELKKEAEFFGDIVIVPFMDNYDLLVLKTLAICEYGVRVVSAKYMMKCDDDTFVRVDSVMNEVNRVPSNRSVYVGSMNYYHKPMRHGKWTVTLEEWPEIDYPPYADGPGYVVSADIANFVLSEFEKQQLTLFRMEDVSMGIWVKQFNNSKHVEYLHNDRFCQSGCINGYFTAHYQSPRQMMCLWDKLQRGRPRCCNMR